MTKESNFLIKKKQQKYSFFFIIISKYVASFLLHCLPTQKRHKESRNLGKLRWFCLFFYVNKHIVVRISATSAFYARVGVIFP